MNDSPNWDEFRIVRAIAEAQSLAAAAERLGVNHSTLFRRLAAMEARLGMRLFERERGGYRPTAAGADMAALATLMGETIEEFERRIAGHDIRLSGLVRLAAPRPLCTLMAPAILSALARAHPEMRIDLIGSDTAIDLLNGEADVAICALEAPPRDGLIARRTARLAWGLFAAEPLEAGEPASWVFPRENFGPPRARQWLEQNVHPSRRTTMVAGYLTMAEIAARGRGAALLPAFVAATKPELRRIGEADPDLDSDVWVVAHPQALRAPRVRALFDFVADELERRRAWFAGEAVVDP